MALSAVSISFKNDLLQELDIIAKDESSTRSELINRAARIYIERKRDWENIFAYGSGLSSKHGFTEEDICEEIREYRKEKKGAACR